MLERPSFRAHEAAETLAAKLGEVAAIGRPSSVALDADEAERLLWAVKTHMPVASRRGLRSCRRIERTLGAKVELAQAAGERDAAAERVRDLAIDLVAEERANLSEIARLANVSRGTLYAWLKLPRKS